MNPKERLKQLTQQRAAILAQMENLIGRATGESRDLTPEEATHFDTLDGQIKAKNAEIERIGRTLELGAEERAEGGEPQRRNNFLPGGQHNPAAGSSIVLRNDQKLTDYARVNTPEYRRLSVGRYLRGILTGNWDNAAEERAMSIGTLGAGGYLVPTPLAAQIIDLARAKARVMMAGAVTVPMTATTLKLARVTGDPTAAWRTENSGITATDVSLDTVTLTAKTLAAQVKFSRELFEDAENLDALLSSILAKDFALAMDKAALYGAGSGGEPTGLVNAGVGVTSMGTNGGQLTDYDPWVDAIAAIEVGNFEPNATIYSPRTQQAISKMKNTLGDPLGIPKDVADLAFLDTNQVPNNETQGTAAGTASSAFVGQWDQVMFGMRTDFSVQLLDQRYADTGQLAILAWMRGDVQFAHIAAFNRIQGIIP